MKIFSHYICAVSSFLLCCGIAHGTEYYIFSSIPTGYNENSIAGEVQFAGIHFNDVTNHLRFYFEVAPSNTTGVTANGFTVVINSGQMPGQGETAMFYLDAQNPSQPKLSVYEYNGTGSDNSYLDGSSASGVQPAGLIKNYLNTGYQVILNVQELSGGRRSYDFTVDTSDFENYIPLYGTNESPGWTGPVFSNNVGVWLFPVFNPNATYGGNGALTSWVPQFRGSYDWPGVATVVVANLICPPGILQDRCGVCGGDGGSCLGCTSGVDTAGSKAMLDGNAAKQRALIGSVLRRASKRADRSKYMSTADSLYLKSWIVSWTELPQVQISCTNTVFCQASDNSRPFSELRDNSLNFVKLLSKITRAYQKTLAVRIAKSSTRTMSKLHVENLKAIESFPKGSSCAGP